MLGHLESMTQLLQEERDFYKREFELLRNMKEKSALMSPPTRERVMNYSMSFWETWTEGNHSYSLFHCKRFFSNVNSLLPFLEKFLICKKEMLADRPRAWLPFADLQTPFFPLEEFVEKKKSSEDFVVIWVKLSLGILHSLEQGVFDWNSERSRRKR